jgi:hypothetical protein
MSDEGMFGGGSSEVEGIDVRGGTFEGSLKEIL